MGKGVEGESMPEAEGKWEKGQCGEGFGGGSDLVGSEGVGSRGPVGTRFHPGQGFIGTVRPL